MLGSSWGMVLLPDLKVKSLLRRGRVFCSLRGTLVYSQLRHPQKRAPQRSVARALSRGVLAVW